MLYTRKTILYLKIKKKCFKKYYLYTYPKYFHKSPKTIILYQFRVLGWQLNIEADARRYSDNINRQYLVDHNMMCTFIAINVFKVWLCSCRLYVLSLLSFIQTQSIQFSFK